MKFWSVPEGRLLATREGHAAEVSALAMASGGEMLISGSQDGTVRMWSLPEGRLRGTIESASGSINALATAPGGLVLASISSDPAIKVWLQETGRLLAVLEGHGRDVTTLTLTPDGKTLASGSQDNLIKLWSLPEGRLLATLTGHTAAVRALAITPDSNLLISASTDGMILLWNLKELGFRSFLFDAAANPSDTKGMTYNVYDQILGRTVTFTLPCGSPIPPGATCICNCVPGTYRIPPPPRSRGTSSPGGTYCTCNKICTCVPVRY